MTNIFAHRGVGRLPGKYDARVQKAIEDGLTELNLMYR